jgi:hypothetical protein
MAGGQAQTAGTILTVLGIIISLIPGGAAIGVPLIYAGTIIGIAGQFLTPITPDGRSDSKSRSATYGLDQFDNPVERDAVLPIIYSEDGHPCAPPYAMAFGTPVGQQADDELTTNKTLRGQALSALFTVAPHRVGGYADMKVNDDPAFDEVTGYALGKGTGTKQTFNISGKRIVKSTVRVQVNGVEIRVVAQTQSVVLIRRNQYLYTLDLPNEFDPETGVSVSWGVGQQGPWQRCDLDVTDPDGTFIRPIVWLESPTRLRIFTQGWDPAPNVGTNALLLTYGVRTWLTAFSGTKLSLAANGSLDVVFTKAQAPASGAVLTSDFWRLLVPGMDVQFRRGLSTDLPLLGFSAIRQTYGNGQPLDQTAPIEVEVHQEVDDVQISVGSVTEFRKYDDDGGNSAVTAQIQFEFRQANAAGAYPATGTKVPNPAGR